MHDPIFLAGKSDVATKENWQAVKDLLDTLLAHKDRCVGMAANMIGVKKRISAFLDKSGRVPVYTVMLNPEIIKKTARITPRKDAYLFLVANVRVSATNPSRLSTRLWRCRTASRPVTAGPYRSSSMRSIIAMEC